MTGVIRVKNEKLRATLAAILGANSGSQRTAEKMRHTDFEAALMELVSSTEDHGKQILSAERLAETNKSQDESERMLPRHDTDWRAVDNLAHECLLSMYATMDEYHALLHEHRLFAARTGEADTDALPQVFQLAVMEQQSRHLAFAFIVQSHLELCRHYGRSGSALLHLDRLRSQVEERSQYRFTLFKQALETKKNAQPEGRGNKTNKTKSVARKADRSNVPDKGKDQGSRKGYKGVEAKEIKTRSARSAQVQKR